MGKDKKKNKKLTSKDKNYEDFKNEFNSEEDRIGHSATMIIATLIGVYFLFNQKKFLSLFYTPGAPMWRNFLQFFSIMACCWLFGLFLSKSISYGLKIKSNFCRR